MLSQLTTTKPFPTDSSSLQTHHPFSITILPLISPPPTMTTTMKMTIATVYPCPHSTKIQNTRAYPKCSELITPVSTRFSPRVKQKLVEQQQQPQQPVLPLFPTSHHLHQSSPDKNEQAQQQEIENHRDFRREIETAENYHHLR